MSRPAIFLPVEPELVQGPNSSCLLKLCTLLWDTHVFLFHQECLQCSICSLQVPLWLETKHKSWLERCPFIGLVLTDAEEKEQENCWQKHSYDSLNELQLKPWNEGQTETKDWSQINWHYGLWTTVNSFKSTGSNRKYLKRKWLQNYRLFWPESVSLTGFFNPFRFLFEVSLLVTFYPAFSSEMQLHHWGAPQERGRAPCSPLPCLPWMTPKGDVFPFGVMWL